MKQTFILTHIYHYIAVYPFFLIIGMIEVFYRKKVDAKKQITEELQALCILQLNIQINSMQQSCLEMNQSKKSKFNSKFISIQESSIGLKIVDPVSKIIQVFLFWNNSILMDWNNFFQELNAGNLGNLHFIIECEESKFFIYGTAEDLFCIYKFCAGKYIFKKGQASKTLEIIKEKHDYQLKSIFDQSRQKQYYEHVIFAQINDNLDMSFYSQVTYDGERFIPQEIQIIQDLHITYIPQFLEVDALYHDGVQFSYIYSKKDLIKLSLYYNHTQLDNHCLVSHTASQLVLILLALDEKGIIHPGLDLKNLYINPNTQDIVLASYYQAYYQLNNDQRRLCVNIGYSPPEYFKINQKLTTKANVYQVGISLFQLYSIQYHIRLLGHNPFGKSQKEMALNHTKNILDLSRLNAFDSILRDFIRKLLEQEPHKRPSPQELLKHKLFSISHKEYLSKQTIQKKIQQDIQEFTIFSKTQNIQSVKPTLKFKKRQ
ncbi:unnamed protein product (macronuclear) [Paramecium tetraurelia]|uniref:non-specific serine/threonine protein kinase n=1 Tax=Paramecium tetraurelia TaxID=5888 RepID=A0C3P7_PARTE|nr:uncharacterized protein GSPATT00034893001 [Paramecium tetraurelia]CAK65414.1 unnamed protein product [Paramecium tetraurelia]|eukprot:XP_001432811.1 hypothetical protein (macronuclear) [Paramecium tetraurelia strain d4-2]